MATIYKRKRSPFYWIKWKDGLAGKYIYESTMIRVDDPDGRSKSKMLKMKASLREEETKRVSNKGNFNEWVVNYINSKYTEGSKTKISRMYAWEKLYEFLDDRGAYHPIHVDREMCFEFLNWRKQTVHTNTAIKELTLLSAIMEESVRRNFINKNPAARLGIKKIAAKPKPEITDAEMRLIEAEVQRQESIGIPMAQFLRASMVIATCHGVRISETRIHLYRDVDTEHNTISFHGKGDRYWTVGLNPQLKKWIVNWRDAGLEWSYPTEYRQQNKSKRWYKLFRQIKLPHLCFHCFRVTFISRAERAGIPETVVMRLVNHSSTTVHRIYRRHSDSEMSDVWNAFASNAW